MENSNNILVSICCLAYNHEKFIEQTLLGFVKQKTTFKFEVLIHDDASNDQTALIIKKYAKLYPDIIKPILQEENQYSKGINVQKKFNYPRIEGKYVAYCEGDDYWCDENKLQMQVEALENNPTCTISTHVTEKISKDGTSLHSFFPPVENMSKIITIEDYLKSELVDRNWTFQLSSFLVKKEIIDLIMSNTVEFIDSFRAGDFPLIILALTEGNLYFINRRMSCYRWLSGGFMSNWNNNKKSMISITESFINGYKGIDKYTSYKYHEIIDIGIKYCKFSILIAKENFKELYSSKYSFILKQQPIIKKIAIYIGKHSITLYRLCNYLMNKIKGLIK